MNGRLIGLAAWGYGINPASMPRHLFGNASDTKDYLELSRYFVYDFAPKYTASAFLAATHRVIRKYMPEIKWLYTYAAGFQGMVGTIYQASNYLYIGKQLSQSFIYIPSIGLIHAMSLFHRYGITSNYVEATGKIFGREVYKWVGYNYRYIYFLCGTEETNRLMASAKFVQQPNPTTEDLEIYIVDNGGHRTPVSVTDAKQIPVIKLMTKRQKDSSEPSAIHAEEGGAAPTLALHSMAAAK